MSTREFLEKLDFEQLLVARDLAEEMIKARRDEEKIRLWVVSDSMMNYAAYRDDQYEEAVDRLCAEIRREATEFPGDELRFVLRAHRFRESEVAEMLRLGSLV